MAFDIDSYNNLDFDTKTQVFLEILKNICLKKQIQ